MSTFLQLAQKLRQECRIGTDGQPTTVTSQTGQLKRVCDWTIESWNDIQRRHQNWRWMRAPCTVNTVAEDDTYVYTDFTDSRSASAISRFSRWNPYDDQGCTAWKIYLQSAGVATEGWMYYMPLGDFRRLYKLGSPASGAPLHFTFDEDNYVLLGPKPSAVYVVTGSYQRGVQTLSADGTTPEMPSDYHDLIVYNALEKYGFSAAASESLARARRENFRLFCQLEGNQLPPMYLPPPMA